MASFVNVFELIIMSGIVCFCYYCYPTFTALPSNYIGRLIVPDDFASSGANKS